MILVLSTGKTSDYTQYCSLGKRDIRESGLTEKDMKAGSVGCGKEREKRQGFFVLCALLLLVYATFAVYWNVQDHEFLNLDDDLYVTENANVKAGISKDGFLWAFRSFLMIRRPPRSTLSHMLDCEWYGLIAKGHHLNSLLFHIANTILLFLTLNRMTGQPWPSMGVAAAFALHPMCVESVAWVASRKSVLSTFFWMLTLWTYVRYTEKPGIARYLPVFFSLALGLLAKPILVTLPFVLLLLDYWPLGRFHFASFSTDETRRPYDIITRVQGSTIRRVLLEKLPLLALSIASICVSMATAEEQGILLSEQMVPLGLRIQNALVSYLVYIRKIIWPYDLAVFIPYPHSIPLWQPACAGLALIAMTVWAIRIAGRRPYVAVGWFWYLGTLSPVIGLAQQGLWPAVADRFVYIPQIGLFMMAAWSLNALFAAGRVPRLVMRFSLAALLLAMMVVTWFQVRTWRDSVTLFKHALEVTPQNFLAHMNLGTALAKRQEEQEAIHHFLEALHNGHPRPEQVHFNLGLAYAARGEKEQALWHYQRAAQIDPNYADLYINLGSFWLHERNFEESLRCSFRALEITKNSAKAHNNIGVVFLHQGNPERAMEHFKTALRIDPDYSIAKKNLDMAMSRTRLGAKD